MHRLGHLAHSLVRRGIISVFLLLLCNASVSGQTNVISGPYNGFTFTGSIEILDFQTATFTGGTIFTGPNAIFGINASLSWQQVGTLVDKDLSFANGAYIYVNGVNNTLTLDNLSTAIGTVTMYTDGSSGTGLTNQGVITHTSNTGQIYSLNLTNSGTISATAGTLYLGYPSAGYNSTNTGSIISEGASTNVYLRGNFDNNGTITAQNSGIVRFDGDSTTANLGNVALATGGRALLQGTLNNTATTLTAPTGGVFELAGGTISGGTIAAGALTFTSSGGYLSGASLTGDLTLPGSTHVRFSNGATFTGTNLALGANASFHWQQAGTLADKDLTFANGAYVSVNGVNNTLTLDSLSTATGTVTMYTDGSSGTGLTNQGVITHTANTGQIFSLNLTNAGTITATAGTLYLGYPSAGYNSTNTGTITSDGASTNVYLRGNFDNNGTITAQNSGIVRFEGTSTTANLGNVTLATGGRALLEGTFDNTVTTLTAPTGGVFELASGTISGGTIAAGALSFTSSGGYLSGASLTGDLTLPGSTHVRFTNGATFTGTNLALGTNASFHWQQVGTLAGKTLTMANGSYLYVSGAGNQLTLDSATSVSGTTYIYSDGSNGTTVTNQGAINHTGGSASMFARMWTNAGTISVTAGNLSLGTSSTGYAFENAASGLLLVNGGAVSIQSPAASPFLNSGILAVQSGTLSISNTLRNLGLGRIQGAGTVTGDLALDGGTLAPGNSIGTLTFNNSDFTVGAAAALEIEVSGTTADRLTFANPTSPVNIGSDLLTLSLVLLSAPVENQVYTIMNISSGGSGITGRFAGLPNSGDAAFGNFGGTDYLFNISYLANSIQLQAVPEPGTYALMALGLGLVVLLRRRR